MSSTDNASLEHIIITRFNCRFGHVPKRMAIETQRSEAWLDERFRLFETYCLPTLAEQTRTGFNWRIYFDTNTSGPHRERIRNLVSGLPQASIVFCEAFTIEMLKADIFGAVPSSCRQLLTTRLDNDDGLSRDFVERLQASVRPGIGEALNFPVGLVMGHSKLYSSFQPSNAFISVSEPYTDRIETVHCGTHNEMSDKFTVRDIGADRPAWLQVIHGGNVSNKLRGRRIPFSEGRGGFTPLDRMDPTRLADETPAKIALENAVMGTFWAVRDKAAEVYRQFRR